MFAAATLTAAAFAGEDPQNKKNDPTQVGDRKIGKCLNFYSMEKEMALGKQLAQEVSRQAKLVTDPIITEYVNRLGQNLVRNSDAKISFSFQVIEDDNFNAFALPGGYVFIHAGLIKIADEEDELAAAIAHEIAHVAARHLTCRATQNDLAQGASVLLGGLGGLAVRQVGIPMTFLHFSRHDETEADFLGLQYMWAAGYDPNGSISILEKMESLRKSEPNAVSRLFATHPLDTDRITQTQKEIDSILPAKSDYIITSSGYEEMRNRLLKLESGKAAAQKPTLKRAPDVQDDPQAGDARPTLKRQQ
jgi:predicted Zn-dependent protease